MSKPSSTASGPPAAVGPHRLDRRLRAKLEADERLLGWTHGWVSRAGRARWLAARTFDFAVCTDRRLVLLSTGFFTRRPRRRVLGAALEQLTVSDVGKQPGRRLRIESTSLKRPLFLEIRGTPRTAMFVHQLRIRTHEPESQPAGEPAGEPGRDVEPEIAPEAAPATPVVDTTDLADPVDPTRWEST